MKGLVSITALALAAAFATPTLAGGGGIPTTKTECEKASMTWNVEIGKCEPAVPPSDLDTTKQ
jgi:hypothetical protein